MVEMNVNILKKVPRAYFHPKPSVDSVLILLERHEPLILKKDYKKYQIFAYSPAVICQVQKSKELEIFLAINLKKTTLKKPSKNYHLLEIRRIK